MAGKCIRVEPQRGIRDARRQPGVTAVWHALGASCARWLPLGGRMTGMPSDAHDHRQLLQRIARRAMTDYGLLPDFSHEAIAQADAASPAAAAPDGVRDLRHLPWCSIDNDDSRDLDQLTASEPAANGATRILVAIAD